jgi:hypothetical protein
VSVRKLTLLEKKSLTCHHGEADPGRSDFEIKNLESFVSSEIQLPEASKIEEKSK